MPVFPSVRYRMGSCPLCPVNWPTQPDCFRCVSGIAVRFIWNYVPFSKRNEVREREGHREPRGPTRPMRADARRNVETVLEAAMKVFATSGVDAPAREIADKAGVGVGTLYRHFPQRSDLVVAVVEHEVDACADAATAL